MAFPAMALMHGSNAGNNANLILRRLMCAVKFAAYSAAIEIAINRRAQRQCYLQAEL